jgi:hypothetical protein
MFTLACTLVFAVVGAVLIVHHEMWRDELHAWQIARDSGSVSEMLRTYRYESHPALWPFLLMGLSRLFGSPESMQWFHLFISIGTVFLLCGYSPFSRLQKAMLCFGYFMLYEYTVIARNYGIGVFLIFLFCVLYRERDSRLIAISMVLALLANTSLMGLIASIVLLSAMVVDSSMSRASSEAKEPVGRRMAGIQLAVAVTGILVSVFFFMPPGDAQVARGFNIEYYQGRLNKVYHALIGAYFPLPENKHGFWNTLLFEQGDPASDLSLLFIFSMLALVLLRLLEKPVPLMTLTGIASGILLMVYVTYGHIRHFGFLFIALVVALWLEPYSRKWRFGGLSPRMGSNVIAVSDLLFTLMLSIHLMAGVYASYMDYRHPFSRSADVAARLSGNVFKGKIIVGMMDTKASSVLVYMPGVEAYYPSTRRFGTYIRLDTTRTPYREEEAIARTLTDLGDRKHDLVLIFSNPVKEELRRKYRLRLIDEFSGSMVDFEDFLLYEFE